MTMIHSLLFSYYPRMNDELAFNTFGIRRLFLGGVLTKTQLTKNSKELNFLAFFGKNSIFFGNSTDLLKILLHKKSKKGQKIFKELTENAKNSIFDYIRS